MWMLTDDWALFSAPEIVSQAKSGLAITETSSNVVVTVCTEVTYAPGKLIGGGTTTGTGVLVNIKSTTTTTTSC